MHPLIYISDGGGVVRLEWFLFFFLVDASFAEGSGEKAGCRDTHALHRTHEPDQGNDQKI